MTQVVYNHQVFDSISAFRDAYADGTLVRLAESADTSDPRTVDRSWSSRRRPPTPVARDLDDLPGPRSISLAGVRFRLDKAQGFVSWMGWEVHTSFDREMGLSLWNVRFRGERIAYEVRLWFPALRTTTVLKYSTCRYLPKRQSPSTVRSFRLPVPVSPT